MMRLSLMFFSVIFLGFCGVNSENSTQSKAIMFEEGDDIIVRQSCKVPLTSGQKYILSWYQLKGSKKVLLERSQHLGDGSVVDMKLTWTLEPTDNNTQIYCVRDSISYENASTGGKNKYGVMFSKSIKPHNSSVTVTPYTKSRNFNVNDTMNLICNGTKSVDGQNLTWYIKGPDLKPQLAENQTYNAETNVNVLQLHLNETHKEKKLFCAQDFHFQHLPTEDGTIIIDRYRELAKSDLMDLILENEINSELTGDVATLSTPLVIAITVIMIVVVTVIVLAAVWVRRRQLPKQEHEQILDVVTNFPPELTYTALEFTTNGPSNQLKIDQSCDYATITSQGKPADSSPSEVTYASLDLSAARGTNKLKMEQTSAYATIMAQV